MQYDLGPALGQRHRLDREFPRALADPADAIRRRKACPPCPHFDPIGDDKGRIKTDPKLPDQAGVTTAAAVKPRQEFLRTRTRNRAKVRHCFFAGHANPVVANRDRPTCFVKVNLDREIRITLPEFGMVKGFKPQLVAGVGCVGNQFPQEDLTVAVETVDHQVKQLLHFGLETHRLGFGFNLAHRVLVDKGSVDSLPLPRMRC